MSMSRQLRWLKRLRQHMALPRGREVWLWFDLVSIPQRSRDLQIKAISSLPSYTQLCTRSVTLDLHFIFTVRPRDVKRRNAA